MSIIEFTQGAKGLEPACYAVYDQKADEWLTTVWEEIECVPVFQSRKDAENVLEQNPKGRAIVIKVAPSEVAEKIVTKRNNIRGLLLIAASGEVQKIVLRGIVN